MYAGLYKSIKEATKASKETLGESLSISLPANTNSNIKAARTTDAPSPVIKVYKITTTIPEIIVNLTGALSLLNIKYQNPYINATFIPDAAKI